MIVKRPSNSLVQKGLKEFTSIKSKKRISYNSAYNAQTKRLKKIIMPSARWEFVVFEDSTPNAFALPGGKVVIHTGLFQITQSDAGLALLFSRKTELEADRIGALYMAKAGYNPNEAVSLWQRFVAYKQKNSFKKKPVFLSTHPLDSMRINTLKACIPTVMKEYKRR